MWALVLSVVLNLQTHPLFPLSDGSWVYMRTTKFTVAVGHFATRTECQNYTLPQDAAFIFTSTDEQGNPVSVELPFSTLPYNVVGCERVL